MARLIKMIGFRGPWWSSHLGALCHGMGVRGLNLPWPNAFFGHKFLSFTQNGLRKKKKVLHFCQWLKLWRAPGLQLQAEKEVRKQKSFSYLTSSHGLIERMATSEVEDLKWDMRREDRRTYSIIYTALKTLCVMMEIRKNKIKETIGKWSIIKKNLLIFD